MPLLIDTVALRQLLNERGMSLRDLADRTGLSWTFVKYLANGTRNPRPGTAESIAEALGVPRSAFLVTPRGPGSDRPTVDDPRTAGPGSSGQGVAA